MLEILKAVTGNIKQQRPAPRAQTVSNKTVQLADGEQARVLEEDGDIEILEVEDTQDEAIHPTSKKKRPNDRVSVRYADGRVDNDVKYKKVKADIESGQAELV